MGHRIPRLGWRRQLGGLGGGYAPGIDYLLDANFGNMADAGAPLGSPLAVDVGQLALVQNDGQFSISGGELVIPAQSTPAWGDLMLYMSTPANAVRFAGMTLFMDPKYTSATVIWMHGFEDAALPALSPDEGDYLLTSNYVERRNANGPVLFTTTQDTIYQIALVLRNVGSFHYAKGGVNSDWTLTWVGNEGIDTTLYPFFNAHTNAGDLRLFRLASLADNATYPTPELGTRDLDLSTPGTGTGTSSIAVPATGNTFVHTADVKLTYTVISLPTAVGDRIDIRIRRSGGLLVYIQIFGDGDFAMGDEGAAWISAPASISAGNTITIVANGNTYSAYADDTLLGTYIESDNIHIAFTDGIVQVIHAGAGVANLEARTLDGIANVASSNFPGYGLATDVLPGPRAALDTFTHEADAIIEIDYLTLPTGGAIKVEFRVQDAINYWFFNIDTVGTLRLREVVAGVTTVRGSSAVSEGELITVICDDESITFYFDTTLAFIYLSAANFKTETNGLISSLGTGGEVSDLITWPLSLASAPNTPGAVAVKAAFDLMATP